MSYVLKIIEEPGYLHFQISGDNSIASVRGYLGEIRAACMRHACEVILIEENLQGPGLGLVEIFEGISAESAATATTTQQIAYVDTNPEHSPSNMQFAETIAVARGVNVRMFSSVADARAWLQQTIAQPPSSQTHT